MQLLAKVEEECARTRNEGVFIDFEGQKLTRFAVDRQVLEPCTIRRPVQMLQDLIQVDENWDSAPNPASSWWTSTYDFVEKKELMFDTKTGSHRILLEENCKILGCILNRPGKAHEGI